MLSRAEQRQLQRLQQRKQREESGLFLAEGVRIVEELVASPIDLRLAVCSTTLEDTERGRALARRLAERVRTERVSDPVLGRLAATDSSQGVLVAAHIPQSTPDSVRFGERAMCLVLDAVQDPGNFGTLVRAADAFCAVAVIALPGSVDAWNPKAVRSAAGSSFRVPILPIDLSIAAAWLRKHEFQFLAADARGVPIQAIARARRFALCLGSEGAGISAEVRALADEIIAVPIPGPTESLNVGVAAGILLYVLTREA